MWGIRRGFVLIQDGGNRSHKDFWVYNCTWEGTQVFTGICGVSPIVIQINKSINLGHGFKAGRKIAPNTGANATKCFTLATKS